MAASAPAITPPPGYTLEQPQQAAPTPPPGYTIEGQTPAAPTATLSSASSADIPMFGEPGINTPQERLSMPLVKALVAVHDKLKDITGMTQEGRAEHPIQAKIGDVVNGIEELLLGGQAAGKPMGTSSGVLNNPVSAAILPGGEVLRGGALAKDVEPIVVQGLGEAGAAVKEGVSAVAGKAGSTLGKVADVGKQVLKGEKVAQAPATEALGKAATETAQSAGVSAPSTENALNSVGQAGNSIIAKAKSQYQALDEATGGRVQRFQDRLNTIHDKLSELTGTEEDNLKEAKLLQAQKDTEDAMNEAFADAKAKGVDPAIIQQANADFKQGNALKDLDMNIFRSRVVQSKSATGESNLVNPQKLLPRLQALYKSGRLTQAFGGNDEAAIDLLKQTSDFARTGKVAARMKRAAVGVAGAVGAGVLAREGWQLVNP